MKPYTKRSTITTRKEFTPDSKHHQLNSNSTFYPVICRKFLQKKGYLTARYQINEEEAEVVRKIYRWFGVDKISLREIIKRLYDEGIPPKKRKNDFWTKGPIVRMLRCDSYAKGLVYYNKHEAVVAKKPIKNEKYKKIKRSSRRLRPKDEWISFKVPRIIEDDGLYEKVQRMLNYNQKYACKKRKYEYLLSGLVMCECGSPRVGDGVDGRNFYYRCAERIYKFPFEKKCNLQGMNALVLDQTVWKELVNFLKHPGRLKKCAEA